MWLWKGLVSVGLVIAAFAACSSDVAGSRACAPGESRQCGCTSGELGAQACRADGSGFDACACQSAAGGAGQGGAGQGGAGADDSAGGVDAGDTGPGGAPGAAGKNAASGAGGSAGHDATTLGAAALGELCFNDEQCESGACGRVLGEVARVCVTDPQGCAYLADNDVVLTSDAGPCAGDHGLWHCQQGQWLKEACPDEARECLDGACGLCRPGTPACAPYTQVVRCSDDGSSYELLKDCFDTSTYTCQASTFTCGTGCDEGQVYGCATDSGHRVMCKNGAFRDVLCPIGQHCVGFGECIAGEPFEIVVAEQAQFDTKQLLGSRVVVTAANEAIVTYHHGYGVGGSVEARHVDLKTRQVGAALPLGVTGSYMSDARPGVGEPRIAFVISNDAKPNDYQASFLWLQPDASAVSQPSPLGPGVFPNVAVLAADVAVVTWGGSESSAIKSGGRILGPGALKKDLTLGDYADYIRLAPLGAAGFVAAWRTPSGQNQVQCFDSDGTALLEQPLLVPNQVAALAGAQGRPAVVILRTEAGFVGHHLSTKCAFAGDPIEIPETAVDAQLWPNGNLLVVLRAELTQGARFAARAYDTDGLEQGARVMLTGTDTTGVTVAVWGDDSFAATWTTGSHVYLRAFEHPFAVE